ncbi:hypothetical protein PEX1_005410 [Penicillium expansum]|uniref:Uncharacterized protein n=1 Tax=Penicillium expansum TaxID=27334 RepID=A0A0A2KS15_PENEN|nr:hypothetical protein PEX2_005510 [Penicillium expansum]KGO39439.1 hypothetical protein PEXP_042800 [Penicillium expansum]KGO55829.1 hypothetical protein PEX2_005510 [Penicillium expansum]KGO70574.1 hypothetical protein PEX1_005410 [Penicillium expansum]
MRSCSQSTPRHYRPLIHKGESQTCWRASHVLAEKRGIKAKSSLLADYHPFFF